MESTQLATELDSLHQVLSTATHEASAAMCRWTDGVITMSLDEVVEVPIEDACETFDTDAAPLMMAVLTLDGDVGGTMILAFDDVNGRQLAATLLNRPPSAGPEWTELDRSALAETGNILGCAYMNALTRLVDVELIPSPPHLIEDFGASVLQQAVVDQAAANDSVLICRTVFTRQGEQLEWDVLFVPTHSMRDAMRHALRPGIH